MSETFKIGDIVHMVHKDTTYGWSPRMDQYLASGDDYVIRFFLDNEHAACLEGTGDCIIPLGCLEHAEEKSIEKKQIEEPQVEKKQEKEEEEDVDKKEKKEFKKGDLVFVAQHGESFQSGSEWNRRKNKYICDGQIYPVLFVDGSNISLDIEDNNANPFPRDSLVLADEASCWQRRGAYRVVHQEYLFEDGLCLHDIFNFETGDRLLVTKDLRTGEMSPQLQKPEDIPAAALNAARAAFVAQGGKMPKSEAFIPKSKGLRGTP